MGFSRLQVISRLPFQFMYGYVKALTINAILRFELCFLVNIHLMILCVALGEAHREPNFHYILGLLHPYNGWIFGKSDKENYFV